MKEYLITSLLSLIGFLSYAQTDTVYLNKYRKEVVEGQSATSYRIIKAQDSSFHWTEFDLNGKIKMAFTLSSIKPEVFDGSAAWYSEEGFLATKGFYRNNKREDHFINYYPDGAIKSDAMYKANALDGEHKFYYPDKRLKRVDIYKEGKFISGRCYTPTGAEQPYYSYLQNPEFVGGVEKLAEYMTANLVYPKQAIREDITGIVKVKFTVTADGEIKDAELENTIHSLLDNEALRLVKNMPRWKPGLEDNKKADFKFILPVNFRLQD